MPVSTPTSQQIGERTSPVVLLHAPKREALAFKDLGPHVYMSTVAMIWQEFQNGAVFKATTARLWTCGLNTLHKHGSRVGLSSLGNHSASSIRFAAAHVHCKESGIGESDVKTETSRARQMLRRP